MSADLLRKAAEILRERIGTASADGKPWVIPGPWSVAADRRQARWEIVPELDETYDVVARTEYDHEARYIATMHPGVGLALANALDSAADYEDVEDPGGDGEGMRADLESIARLILGGAS